MNLKPWQAELVRRRLPTFDAEACATLFSTDQPERAGNFPSIRLANGAVWYPDPWKRPLNDRGRPIKVKAAYGCPRNYIAHTDVDQAHEVILVEGEADYAALASNGITNVVCVGGIQAALSTDSAYLQMRRQLLKGKDIRILFDFDDEGRQGAARVARQLLAEAERTGIGRVYIAKPRPEWPQGKDILDFAADRLDPTDPLDVRSGTLLGAFRFTDAITRPEDVPDPERAKVSASVGHDAPSRARILSWDEFMSAQTPAAIVPTLIYEGSSHVLNGASKAGKSTLATQLAMCVAGGVPFLGIESAQQPVLLISLEMSAGLVRDRFRDIARDTGIPMPDPEWFNIVAPTVSHTPQINLTDPAGEECLRQLIAESGARLVILDTLYRFLPGTDFSDNGEMGKVMGTVNSIANDTGAALLVVHHTSKGNHEGPVSQSGLGAQIIGGAANVIAMLRRVSRDDGGSWGLTVESHYEAPEAPIQYERPARSDGSAGSGCVRVTAAEAQGLDENVVRRLFEEHGEQTEDGFIFRSQNRLIEALMAAELAGSRGDALRAVRAIEGLGLVDVGHGPRGALMFVWRSSQRAPEPGL